MFLILSIFSRHLSDYFTTNFGEGIVSLCPVRQGPVLKGCLGSRVDRHSIKDITKKITFLNILLNHFLAPFTFKTIWC